MPGLNSNSSAVSRLAFRLRPDPDFLYLDSAHRHVWMSLKSKLLNDGCSAILTGEAGVGKTTCIQDLVLNLPKSITAIRINQPRLSAAELLQAVLTQLEAKLSVVTGTDVWENFEQTLCKHTNSDKKVLIIIDDAQIMSDATLEQTLRIIDANVRHGLTFPVFLCGRPDLGARINTLRNADITKSLINRMELPRLPESEITAYIQHRLATVGVPQVPRFDSDALAAIHRHTGGVPKLINILCEALMIEIRRSQTDAIALATVRDVIEKFTEPSYPITDERDLGPAALPADSRDAAVPLQMLVKHRSEVVTRLNLEIGTLLIGRAIGSDIYLKDAAISRRHCRITTTATGSVIEDLASVNGTYCNAQRIKTRSLSDQDIIQIGEYSLIFISTPADAKDDM